MPPRLRFLKLGLLALLVLLLSLGAFMTFKLWSFGADVPLLRTPDWEDRHIGELDAAGNRAVLETAPSAGSGPGTSTEHYSETWNSAVQLSAIMFELKGGTSQSESNAPGKVIFDNFVFSR